MDKDRIAGSAKQVRGSVREAIEGNRRYRDASRRGGREGGWQGAEQVGGAKDAARDALKK